jgi:hypothetical protein
MLCMGMPSSTLCVAGTADSDAVSDRISQGQLLANARSCADRAKKRLV